MLARAYLRRVGRLTAGVQFASGGQLTRDQLTPHCLPSRQAIAQLARKIQVATAPTPAQLGVVTGSEALSLLVSPATVMQKIERWNGVFQYGVLSSDAEHGRGEGSSSSVHHPARFEHKTSACLVPEACI